jgi:hypothetical protein
MALRGEDENALRRMRENVQDEWQVADVVYSRAHELKKLGSLAEAVRILDAGFELIESYSPNMIALLRALNDYSRMVSAVAPLPPLRPTQFHATPVASLAYAQAILHRFLVSTAERFRFRAYVLARCFAVATRYMWMYTRRLNARPDLERDWEQVEALRHDFGALTNESVEQYRAVLISLRHDAD